MIAEKYGIAPEFEQQAIWYNTTGYTPLNLNGFKRGLAEGVAHYATLLGLIQAGGSESNYGIWAAANTTGIPATGSYPRTGCYIDLSIQG